MENMPEEAALEQAQESTVEVVDLSLVLPNKKTITLPSVSVGETLNAVRQALAEFQETAFCTCFSWKFVGAHDIEGKKLEVESTDCNEFAELAAYVGPNTKTCTFELVEDTYDVSKARAHLKRLHDVIGRPYLISTEAKVNEQVPESEEEAADATAKLQKFKQAMPNVADFLVTPDLGQYFNIALSGSLEKVLSRPENSSTAPLSDAIKNVSLSGWNPVPMQRRLRGDLLYIEVVLANEGTVYITATPRGFYVNRCSRHHFDASPAQNAFFAHDLFTTLYGFSATVKLAWEAMNSAADVAMASATAPEPLDAVADLILSSGDSKTAKPANTWILPTDVAAKKGAHTYDSVRAQEAMADLCGPEELGAPREWNDEVQSIASLKPQEFSEKIIKARLEYKIISEFTENCKQIAVAIAEGRIAPLTFADPSQSDIYVYNGIFFNRAEDAKDSFKICEGEDACRKIIARDYNNQKLIRSLGVDGLTTVLCTIVDYKGTRYVGQSIIPGILNQGENSAQLLYGVLDQNKPVTVKNTSLKLMKELGQKLSIPERTIPHFPFGDSVAVESKVENDPLSKLLATADSNQGTTIRVSTEDDVATVAGAVEGIPHVGPVEAKIIRGSDGRNYVMEVMRLTPRDANYVKGEQGTGLVSVEALDKLDDNLINALVLRQELVSIYIQRKVNLARQTLLVEATKKEEEVKAAAPAAAPAAPAAATTDVVVDDVDADGEGPQIVKEASTPEVDDKVINTLAAEYIEKFRAITPASLGIEINPNVFLNFPAAVDAEELQKDEETARDMAKFLITYVLPMVTRQVREGEFYPKDLESMCTLLHRMGVNMRYLGLLGSLAQEQEAEDGELLKQGRQRVHSMPYYWQEFLIVEMLARTCKHMLNGAMRSDKAIAAQPAETVAHLLNHVSSLLGSSLKKVEEEGDKKKQGSAKKGKKAAPIAAVIAPVVVPAPSATADKKKGKVKKGKTSAPVDIAVAAETVPAIASLFSDRQAFLATFSAELQKRFSFTFSVLEQALCPEKEATDAEKVAVSTLRSRLSPVMVIRRIAQQCGFVLAARGYDFQGDVVFRAEDVVDLVPKVKSFEPDSYIPEFADHLNSAAAHMQQGNAAMAFELAQQANAIINQITGPVHPHAFQAADQLTAVLINSSDLSSALHMSQRCLAMSAQLQGLDCQDTLLHHLQLSALYMDAEENAKALQHLQSARYILQVVTGDRHPELANVLLRMSMLYERAGDFESAFQAMMQARFFANDLMKNCLIMLSSAGLCSKHGRVHEAVELQKSGFRTLKELVGADDERLLEAKKNLETYIRAASLMPRAALSAEGEFDGEEDDEEEAKPAAGGNKKKRNHKKSKAKK